MKLLIKIYLFFICLFPWKAQAYSMLITDEAAFNLPLSYTSYSNYFPFGSLHKIDNNEGSLESVFNDAFLDIFPNDKRLLTSKYYPTTSDAVLDLKGGKLDVYLGAFYQTEDFNGLDFVFPSILNNPVHLLMLPERISEVKQVSDLQNLKGIYSSQEMFNGPMLKIFSNLNVTPVESVDLAYEKLLTGEVDFIVGSYYYQYAQIIERGLKDYISFSSSPLWNMPMFIAISPKVENKKDVYEYFRKLAVNERLTPKILENIKRVIKQKEEQSVGTVPPMYVRQSSDSELTPADEAEMEAKK